MRIGIISDTHNNLENLKRALGILFNEGVETLVHCGDMTSPETALLLVEYRLIYVYGNLDVASGEIRQTMLSYDPKNFAGPFFSGTLEGVSIAVVHGDKPGSVEDLASSGSYRFVLHGHTHLHRHQQIGSTWVINPGALGGAHREPRSVCVLDLPTGETEFLKIN